MGQRKISEMQIISTAATQQHPKNVVRHIVLLALLVVHLQSLLVATAMMSVSGLKAMHPGAAFGCRTVCICIPKETPSPKNGTQTFVIHMKKPTMLSTVKNILYFLWKTDNRAGEEGRPGSNQSS